MSHEQGKAATVVNSGRGHQGFNLKFLLRGKVLAGARGSCPAGNHVWAGPAVRRSEHVSQASCNCPVIYYFLLHWKCEICFWFGLRHRILITRVANLWVCNVILSVKMSPWFLFACVIDILLWSPLINFLSKLSISNLFQLESSWCRRIVFFFVPQAPLVVLCFPGIGWFLEVDHWILACD